MIDHSKGLQPGDRLANMDFDEHNASVRECMTAFDAGKPIRVPVWLGTNTRYFMFNPAANPEGLDFKRYTLDPDAMFDAKLRFERWRRFNLLEDSERGLPEKWVVTPDFQNYYDAAWFGCPIEFMDGEVPDTRPIYAECPERVMEQGPPDPFSGIMSTALSYYERFKKRAENETYLGQPIEAGVSWSGVSSDGIMTTACNLFGPVFVCTAMASEPERLEVLFTFIRDAIAKRMKAWRELAGMPVPAEYYGDADDSIALISTSMYREYVLPHHKVMYETFSTSTATRGIHLCGNATRHFPTICKELNVSIFDTGFPVDFGKLRRDVGPNVRIQGGPHVELLHSSSPQAVIDETRRILGTGILEGGKFILREGNNLAPGTPIENTEAMYKACQDYCRDEGVYQ